MDCVGLRKENTWGGFYLAREQVLLEGVFFEERRMCLVKE